jgi:type I restriction enzyme, S subunit
MSGWREVTLGDVCELKRGYDLPKGSRGVGTVPVVSSSGASGFHSEAKVRPPGVVTGRYGTLGKVFYLTEDFWPLNTALYVRDFKDNNPRYVAALLESMNLAQHDGAAAVPGLNRNQLHGLPVQIPDLKHQDIIAGVFDVLDTFMENNRRRVEVLEEMARTIYREWFVHFRYPGHEDATFADSPLGPIPEGWAHSTAAAALDINPRLQIDKTSEHPFITMGDLNTKGMTCFPSEMKAGNSGAKFQNGDTLFARITPCLENGKTGFVQCLEEGQVGRGSTEFIVLRGKAVGPSFTYCLARSEAFRNHAMKSMSGASGRQRVRNECFGKYLLLVPPSSVVAAFEVAVAPLFVTAHSLAVQASQLASIRDLLLPNLVTGRTDVSSLDLDALVKESVA